jgi:hypothetical protein
MTIAEQIKPSITFMNSTGDITISWEKDKEEEMLALVQAKLDQGYTFFLLKPRAGGLLGTKKVPVESIEEIRAAGSFVAPDALAKAVVMNLGDDVVSKAVQNGNAHVTAIGKNTSMESVGSTRNAQEVVRSNSVAIKPISGG